MDFPKVVEHRRLASPTITPQALAWDGRYFWVSSRDLGFLYKVRAGLASGKSASGADALEIMEELDPPGVVWAAVQANSAMHCTIGKGLNDDRYVYRCDSENGFTKLFACPDFTGSYLSYDGANLYLSQWYQQRILRLDQSGNVVQEIDVGAEVCGHAFANGAIYVLRGTENVPRPPYAKGPPTAERFRSGAKQGDEQWWIARLSPRENKPEVVDVAKVPFAARSLTFDGESFWSNHRAANEIVCFSVPD
jgi:hypothetical protein